jgi:hypothetical protein
MISSALKEVHRNNNCDYSREDHPIEHCCNSIPTRHSLCFQSSKIGQAAGAGAVVLSWANRLTLN